jgi:uncharacterized protein YxjI
VDYLITRKASLRGEAIIEDERGDHVYSIRPSSALLRMVLRGLSLGGIVAFGLLLQFLPGTVGIEWPVLAMLVAAVAAIEALLRRRLRLLIFDAQGVHRASLGTSGLRPRWTFYMGDVAYAHLHGQSRVGRYRVEMPGGTEIVVAGDFAGQRYRFTQGDQLLATVSSHDRSPADSFMMEVAGGLDPLPLLAMAVAVDHRTRRPESFSERVIQRMP